MSNLADAIGRKSDIKLDVGTSYMRGSTYGAWDPKYGGQQGWSSNVAEFISNQAHKTSQLQCIVLDTPRIFRYITGGEKHVETIKAMMELHTLTITGFNQQLNVDTDQHTVGSAGQVQEEVVNVTREQPSINITMVDKYGRPIQKQLNFWIRYLLMDPDTNFPLAPIVGSNGIPDLGPDMYTMTCLFFEPNITWTGVNRAWLVVNMFPKTDGDQTSQKDLTQGSTLLNLDIPWSGLAQVGYGVDRLALKLMREINLIDADPFFRKPYTDSRGADVESTGDNDFKGSIEKTGRDAIAHVFPGGGSQAGGSAGPKGR